MKPDKLSVVIPAYNDATYLKRLLAALARQTYPDFEVIVSDAQSQDGTKHVVDSFKNKLKIKLLQSPPQGPAHGRNFGAAAASGQWLLFLDADVNVDDAAFLEKLVDTANARGWQTATTLYRVQDATLLERLGAAFNLYYIRLLAHTKHPVAPGFCILTRRELFKTLKGFDEKLFFGEDYDYVSRAGNRGFGFVKSTYYYQDLRRFRQGNQFKVFWNNVVGELYRHTHHHRIDKPPFKYEFGKHKERS